MKWYETILSYLNQKSTWVGLFALLMAFGVSLSTEMSDAICTCALGVFGLVQVIINEKHKDDK